jgi:hypothetical protein
MSDNLERHEAFEPKSVEVVLIRDLCIAQPTSNNDRHPFLRNRVSIVIRRYTDVTRFSAYVAVSFITFLSCYFGSILCHNIYGCMFSMLLFDFSIMYSYCYIYVSLLLLCMFRFGYSFSVCCSM